MQHTPTGAQCSDPAAALCKLQTYLLLRMLESLCRRKYDYSTGMMSTCSAMASSMQQDRRQAHAGFATCDISGSVRPDR